MKIGERILYYTGGYDKKSQDGTFTTVTALTKTGRFRIEADGEANLYYPDNMRRIVGKDARKYQSGNTPYCRLINEDNKALEKRAMRRLWIERISKVDLEKASDELLMGMISTLNTAKGTTVKYS